MQKKYSIKLDDIQKRFSDNSFHQLKGISFYINCIEEFQRKKNIDSFIMNGGFVIDSLSLISKSKEQANKAISIIRDVNKQLEKYKVSREFADHNYANVTIELNSLLPKIKQEIENPKNQLNEIIKRLILSIVVVTFFIAILRYLARLYKFNYDLLIQAEADDLSIRKFYISLKNTDKNNDERKIVLKSFLENVNIKAEKKINDVDLSKEDSDILKELLNNLMKKL